jgi:hypothetical protein
MVHAFRLIEATGLTDEGSRLWGAVYLHDLARTHDGFCEVHGMHSVLRVNESSDLQERLVAHGVQSDDPSMLLAVMMHCLPDDHSAFGGKPVWPLLALLKDATALDRVRFGDLDPSFFRFEVTKGMVGFAQDLYSQARRIKEGPSHFTDVLKVAERLLGGPVPIPATVVEAAGGRLKIPKAAANAAKGAKPGPKAPVPSAVRVPPGPKAPKKPGQTVVGKPVAAKPAARPAAAAPAAKPVPPAEPKAAKAPAKPVAAKPAAAKPVAAKPTAAKPVANKPTAAKPVANKPTAAKPGAPRPAAAKTHAKPMRR